MLKRNFKIVLDTAQSLKITVLSTAAMNAPPNLFNSVIMTEWSGVSGACKGSFLPGIETAQEI